MTMGFHQRRTSSGTVETHQRRHSKRAMVIHPWGKRAKRGLKRAKRGHKRELKRAERGVRKKKNKEGQWQRTGKHGVRGD